MFNESEVDIPYVIAEIGPNFCVSDDPAKNQERLARLIDLACLSGANAIKLQLKSTNEGGYYTETDLARPAPSGSPFQTRRAYVEAREPTFQLLMGVDHYCRSRGLDWSASPWDEESLNLLMRFDVPWIKLASASLTDTVLLKEVATTGKHVILSTGMSELEEIDQAMEILGKNVTLLYCVSQYPTHPKDIDLKVMETLRKRYEVQVGYSGHERGTAITLAATAMGAVVLERHITMDKDEWGPDHSSSLSPAEFIQMCRDVRDIRRSTTGTGEKKLNQFELAAKARLRR